MWFYASPESIKKDKKHIPLIHSEKGLALKASDFKSLDGTSLLRGVVYPPSVVGGK